MEENHKWQNYVMDKLTLDQIRKEGKLKIPDFQRGVVWTKQHRKEFIETVKSGDPFGVVLVSQDDKTGQYILIDGLQRLSTLRAYMEKPIDFVDENDKFVDQESLRNVFVKKYEFIKKSLPQEARLKKETKLFLKKMIAFLKGQKVMPEADDVWQNIYSALAVPENAMPVLYAFTKFYKKYCENLELPGIVIHAIVYTGDKSNLPQVFETLNTSSVSLTKYEVFSSQWSFAKIPVPDEPLIKKVWSKYDQLNKSSGFEVGLDEASIREYGMTLFEYCFGLSELLCDQDKSYSFLFNKTKKSTDPTGFELLALACGLPVNKADLLDKEENLGGADGKFLLSLKDALMEAIDFVAKTIREWVFDLRGAAIRTSGSYQVYYMIIAVFRHMYILDTKNKEINERKDKAWLSKFNKHAHKWYLFQLLSAYWNKHRQTSDLKSLLDKVMDSDMFVTNIDAGEWKSVYDEYCKGQRETAVGRSIPSESKLFLNYLYRLLINEDKNRENYFLARKDGRFSISFDIEHITPYAKFVDKDKDIPASALGNLCYLPAKDNRSKGEATLYEYSGDRPSLMLKPDFQELIDYPSQEDLDFIEASKVTFITKYNQLLDAREQKLYDRFIKLIIK